MKSIKAKPKVSLPIPAPAPSNYAGILEQMAQSLQDVVAELRKISSAYAYATAYQGQVGGPQPAPAKEGE